jgi:hypothetical protein
MPTENHQGEQSGMDTARLAAADAVATALELCATAVIVAVLVRNPKTGALDYYVQWHGGGDQLRMLEYGMQQTIDSTKFSSLDPRPEPANREGKT